MVTQKGDNTFVVGIHGNFDQAQTGVKHFGDKEMAAGISNCRLSVLLREFHQYWTSGATDCLLCICICKIICKWCYWKR